MRARRGLAGKIVPLPVGKVYHFFICHCHHQGSSGDQSHLLKEAVEARGLNVWYNNGQERTHRNLAGMHDGVRKSLPRASTA